MDVLIWWWVFAISQLVVLAYLKKEESNLFMTGISCAVLFMSVHGFGRIILVSLICGAFGFAFYKFYDLKTIDTKSMFWVTCGLAVQDPGLFVSFVLFYMAGNSIFKIAKSWNWKADQHTLQLISILLCIPIYWLFA